MERNRVSPIQAIVAIFVVLLIGVVFLLPILRTTTIAPEVSVVMTATPLPRPTDTLLPPTPLPPTPIPPTPIPPTPIPPTPIPPTPIPPTPLPTPTLSPTPIPQLPTVTLAAATATAAPTDPPLPLPVATVTATVAVQSIAPLTVTTGVTTALVNNGLPTNTSIQIEVTITPTLVAEPLPIEPTNTSTPTAEPAADLTFGFLTNHAGCQMVTAIIAQLLQDNYQLQIRQRAFTTAEELYANVAHQVGAKTPVDLTVCYRFPDDGKYLKQHGSLLQILGSDYAQENKVRWYVMTHSTLPLSLRTERVCVYELIGHLNFRTMQFQEQDAASWIKNHPAEVAAMMACSKAG